MEWRAGEGAYLEWGALACLSVDVDATDVLVHWLVDPPRQVQETSWETCSETEDREFVTVRRAMVSKAVGAWWTGARAWRELCLRAATVAGMYMHARARDMLSARAKRGSLALLFCEDLKMITARCSSFVCARPCWLVSAPMGEEAPARVAQAGAAARAARSASTSCCPLRRSWRS